MIGPGTVLNVDQVKAVGEAGGTLIIAPNANPAVIAAVVEQSGVAVPGIATPPRRWPRSTRARRR